MKILIKILFISLLSSKIFAGGSIRNVHSIIQAGYTNAQLVNKALTKIDEINYKYNKTIETLDSKFKIDFLTKWDRKKIISNISKDEDFAKVLIKFIDFRSERYLEDLSFYLTVLSDYELALQDKINNSIIDRNDYSSHLSKTLNKVILFQSKLKFLYDVCFENYKYLQGLYFKDIILGNIQDYKNQIDIIRYYNVNYIDETLLNKLFLSFKTDFSKFFCDLEDLINQLNRPNLKFNSYEQGNIDNLKKLYNVLKDHKAYFTVRETKAELDNKYSIELELFNTADINLEEELVTHIKTNYGNKIGHYPLSSYLDRLNFNINYKLGLSKLPFYYPSLTRIIDDFCMILKNIKYTIERSSDYQNEKLLRNRAFINSVNSGGCY